MFQNSVFINLAEKGLITIGENELEKRLALGILKYFLVLGTTLAQDKFPKLARLNCWICYAVFIF